MLFYPDMHCPNVCGMWAVNDKQRRTPLLTANPILTANEEVNAIGSGFCVPGEDVTVGVECDFTQNTLRFYLNDKPIVVSTLPSHKAVDEISCKPLEPLVWSIKPKLTDCFAYLAVFEADLRAEFIDWTPPLLSSS